MDTRRREIVRATAAGLATLGAPVLVRAQGTAPLRIGAVLAVSGAYGAIGEAMLRGITIAADRYNAEGGLLGRKIEVAGRDDKFSGAGAIAAMRELAGSGVNLMIGGSSSVTALAVLPLLQELKSVFVVAGASAMGVTHENYSRYMFRTVANNYVQYGALGRAMAEQFPAATNWAVVVPDSAYGRDVYKMFTSNLRQYHARAKALEVRAPILVSGSQTDFRAQINTLMNSPIDGLFVATVGGPTVAFFQQARAVGLDKKLKVMCEPSGDLTAKTLGRDMPASFWAPIYWPYQVEPTRSSKASQALYKPLVEMTKDTAPLSVTNLGYRAALALFEGVRKAGSTETEAVIQAMEGLGFDSPNGPYRIRRQDHQAVGSVSIAQYTASDKVPYYDVRQVKTVSEESVIESPSPGAEYIL